MSESLFDVAGDQRVRAAVAELRRVPGWPADPVKDEEYVRELQRQFPALALVEEIQAWAAWMLGHETKKKVRHHVRFRNWCTQSVRFRSRSRPGTGGGAGSPVGRVGAAPQGVDAFGSESGRVDRW
jgi:hypothetical protein